jgi:hypothetical protein
MSNDLSSNDLVSNDRVSRDPSPWPAPTPTPTAAVGTWQNDILEPTARAKESGKRRQPAINGNPNEDDDFALPLDDAVHAIDRLA